MVGGCILEDDSSVISKTKLGVYLCFRCFHSRNSANLPPAPAMKKKEEELLVRLTRGVSYLRNTTSTKQIISIYLPEGR